MSPRNSLWFVLLAGFLATAWVGAATVTVRGYGLGDPSRYQGSLQSTEAAKRAALLDLKRQLLYLGGTEVQKTSDGYAIINKGRIGDAEPEYRSLSPVFAEAASDYEIPEALSQRVMQQIQVNVAYTGALDVNAFGSAKAYLNWVDDSLVKALGDELSKKGWFKGGASVTLEFLHFERSLGKKKIAAKIWYVAKK
ncbi:MAG: hypothetical protein J0L75_02110 [Spirochaetes bacterium]|nr:hypothetical protein [Spirochaetota bacterium]